MPNDQSGSGLTDRQEILQGEIPDASEVFYFELGQELFKRTLPFANDVLRQLLTFSVTLMGGSVFFLAEANCHRGLRLAAMVLFFWGMIAAFFGVLPYRDQVCLNEPAAVRDNVHRVIAWKDSLIWAASIFIVLGLVAAFVGVLLN